MKVVLRHVLLGLSVPLFAGSVQDVFAQDCTLWVNAATGSDSNAGSTQGAPLATLQQAARLVVPGSVVCVVGGSTPYTSSGQYIMQVSTAGTASQPITFMPAPGSELGSANQVNIQLGNLNVQGIEIGTGSNNIQRTTTVPAYIVIKGFDITGNNANVTPLYEAANCQQGVQIPGGTSPCSADAAKRSGSYPQYNATCVLIDGRRSGTTPATLRPHHIDVVGNNVHDCSSGGIAVLESDYVNLSYNTVYNTGFYTVYGTSAIDLVSMWDSVVDGGLPQDSNFDGFGNYHVVITQNKVFNTQEFVGFKYYRNQITDGEGIILDTFQNASSQDGVKISPFGGRSLVADNLAFGNGSAGIEILNSYHVDVLNNSTYGNARNNSPGANNQSQNGEINVRGANDINAYNNIFEPADSAQHTVNIVSRCNCTFGNNDLYNGINNLVSGVTKPAPDTNIYTDPRYTAVSTSNFGVVDLTLTAGSGAIGSGESFLLPPAAYGDAPRLAGTSQDIGAYQQSAKGRVFCCQLPEPRRFVPQ